MERKSTDRSSQTSILNLILTESCPVELQDIKVTQSMPSVGLMAQPIALAKPQLSYHYSFILEALFASKYDENLLSISQNKPKIAFGEKREKLFGFESAF